MRFFCLLLLLFGLTISLPAQRNVLEKLITSEKNTFGDWVQDPAKYEIQVLYTQIDRNAAGEPSFTTYRYGVDPGQYFYPASTVKMPAAFMALEKINELGVVGLDKYAVMQTFAATAPQTAALADATAASGLPSVAQYVRKIFLVSDNDAYNRLYEFLGQRYFNEKLQAKGFTDTRIIHRLSVSGYDTLGNRLTNPVQFVNEQGPMYHQGEVYSSYYNDFGLTRQQRGVAYMDNNGEIINESFDFRYKNYVAVQDLHDILKAVIFPQSVSERERFNLTAEDYAWVYRAMAQFPRESDSPAYDHEDHYVKFWIYGDQDSTAQIPKNVRILNKVGWAYGYLTDAAYIVDMDAGVEFFLVGTIHVNDNQIYNDGVYEYEGKGLPFFGELGRAVYEHELKRKRKNEPDFSWLEEVLKDE
ncbi:serine hydrolase [Lewinella cohaerens]|uniref:serine hydrolase n=1 Tax=Lewinella cohaerens TaxID=70995 RepID=UPI000363D70E|nr:serine hydrolase [Lewinella cohaerens]